MERWVAELRLPDGTLTCKEKLIRHQFEQFYSDLYSTEELDHKGMEDYLDSASLSRIPPVDKANLERDIMPTEALASIHRLQRVNLKAGMVL
ncbi:hypothetical protein NDU88_001389 [Pleurodeles waltl]|uniref:Uncharacterized protein n=1 Tax=Pleurodeles waltl TaxID=8319 RepID=A0AAV7UWN5_PLEWA|nr:hypothetical protein NDU88_001389 [Pleurodeles waltl]